MRNLKHCTKGSNVAKHTSTFNHVIDFNNSKIIDKANNWSRKTLESWHTAKTIVPASKTISHSLKETQIFFTFFNILSGTCFYFFTYENFLLYLNFFRFHSSDVFLSIEDSSSVCRKLIVFFKTFYQRTVILISYHESW